MRAVLATTASRAQRATPRERTIHLVNPLWDAHGGADLRTVDLYRLLGDDQPVRLWSEYCVDRAFRSLDVQTIWPWRHPRGGTVVLVGVYFRNGAWLRRADARQIVVVYNTDQPDRLLKTLRRIGDRPTKIVYASEALRESTQRDPRFGSLDRRLIDGVVLESFVEPTAFDAVFHDRSRDGHRPRGDRFTVGRLSRDNPRKHHPSDSPFFTELAGRGMQVRVMGGATALSALRGSPNVDILPCGALPSAAFLSSLDAFYYRTHPSYFEAFGRVVLEAMLCGIPVVAEGRGGYAEHIRHGENGFLFDDQREAQRHLEALRADAGLRARIGTAAHATAERLFRFDLPERTRRALVPSTRALAFC
jgi:glycosyltransferase involved in cell wall biosynthesis